MGHHVLRLTLACVVFSLGLTLADNVPTGDIVFQSDRDGDFDIYVMDAGGDNVRNLTNNDVADADPTLSPSGDKVAFCTALDGKWDIYVVDINGENPVNLTNSGVDEFQPAWSPDGTRIAFAAGGEGDRDIVVISLANGKRTVLVDDGLRSERPAWSPDSTTIAFQSGVGGPDGRSDVYVVDAREEQGQEEAGRLTSSLGEGAEPAWSPDGRIALRRGDDIYVLDLDEGTADSLGGERPGGVHDAEPSWCANGYYLAFRSSRGGSDEIYMMSVDGSGRVNLTVDPASDRHPCWR